MDWLCQAIDDHTCKIKKLVSKTGEPFLVTSKTSMFCTHAPLPAKLKKKTIGKPLLGEWPVIQSNTLLSFAHLKRKVFFTSTDATEFCMLV